MADFFNDGAVKIDTCQPPLFTNASTYKSIKVFARRPNDIESSAKTSRKEKKSKGNADEFSAFYSPTHHEYDSLKKGKLDISTIFKKIPISPRCVHSPEPMMTAQRQTRKFVEVNTNYKPKIKISNRNEVLLTKQEQRICESQTADMSMLSQQCYKQSMPLDSRVVRFQNYAEEQFEKSRVRRQETMSQLSMAGLSILETHGHNSSQFSNIDQLSNIMDENLQISKITSFCSQAPNSCETVEEQQARQIRNKAQLINQLSQQLRSANQQIARLRNTTQNYELAYNQLSEKLSQYKQSNKYLQAQLHVHKHWRVQQSKDRQYESDNKKLVEINAKLREQLEKIKKKQRMSRNQLFELTPDNSDNEG